MTWHAFCRRKLGAAGMGRPYCLFRVALALGYAQFILESGRHDHGNDVT